MVRERKKVRVQFQPSLYIKRSGCTNLFLNAAVLIQVNVEVIMLIGHPGHFALANSQIFCHILRKNIPPDSNIHAVQGTQDFNLFPGWCSRGRRSFGVQQHVPDFWIESPGAVVWFEVTLESLWLRDHHGLRRIVVIVRMGTSTKKVVIAGLP